MTIYATLKGIEGKIKTYFFKDSVDEERRIQGEKQKFPSLEGASEDVKLVSRLQRAYPIRFIVGTSIYDNTAGKSKYQLLKLNHGEEFPQQDDSYVEMQINALPTLKKAENAERKVLKKLTGLCTYHDNLFFSTDIREIKPYGFLVLTAVDFSNTNMKLENLEEVINGLLANSFIDAKQQKIK